MSSITRSRMIQRCRSLIHDVDLPGRQRRVLFAAFTTRRALQIEMAHLCAWRGTDLVLVAAPDAPFGQVPGVHVVSLPPSHPLSDLWEIGAASTSTAEVLTAVPRPGEPPLTHDDPPTRALELLVATSTDARTHLHGRLDQLESRLGAGILDQARLLAG